MRSTLCIALGAAWIAGAGAYTSPHHATSAYRHAAVDSTQLARQLVGSWKGTRYASASSARKPFTMTWKTAADGHLSGTITPAAGAPYETNVVWSSDTGFVTESAPHRSKELNEEVVSRMVGHLHGDSLSGQFELRPMTYGGRTVAGDFTAARQK